MTVEILIGDAVAKLRDLPANSVHCIVTSPPYHGLRDYGTGAWEGGDPACDHRQVDVGTWNRGRDRAASGGTFHDSPIVKPDLGIPFRDICGKCGAQRVDQQIGLEATPELWAARLVEVFREVRRVLRPDGVCFVNVGDGYNSGSQFNGHKRKDGSCALTERNRYGERQQGVWPGARPHIRSLKHKDLIGQPWMVAFALRADGWWLRSEIIWSKPNPMPESVRDRPTKAHEQVFLLTKSPTYYYDQEAVRERGEMKPQRRLSEQERQTNGHAVDAWKEPRILRDEPAPDGDGGRNARSVWTIATEPFSGADLLADYVGADGKPYRRSEDCPIHGRLARLGNQASLHAPMISTEICLCEQISVDHFATFPTELARRCILAGTSAKGCCPACGAPWARVVETEQLIRPRPDGDFRERNRGGRADGFTKMPNGVAGALSVTTGWRATCACDAGEPVPCTVLDPFGGSGTTGLVAEQLGRNAILIELSPQYAEMARRRIDHARARRAIGDVAERPAVLPGQGELAL